MDGPARPSACFRGRRAVAAGNERRFGEADLHNERLRRSTSWPVRMRAQSLSICRRHRDYSPAIFLLTPPIGGCGHDGPVLTYR